MRLKSLIRVFTLLAALSLPLAWAGAAAAESGAHRTPPPPPGATLDIAMAD